MGIAVRREDLIETVAAIRGVGPEDVLLKPAVMQLSIEVAKRFRSGINLCIQNAIQQGKERTAGSALEDPGQSIFGGLVRAFYRVCNQSPLANLHKRRLPNARRKLMNSPPARGAVKQIAPSSGLTEPGRFSVEYRRLYGELPSTTLKRNPYL